MAKRSAPAHHFPPQPIAKIETASALSQANRRVSDLQKKVVDLKKELDLAQKEVAKAHESKDRAIQEVKLECSAFKRANQQLELDNEKLMNAHSSFSSTNMYSLQRQQQKIKDLEEQLNRIHCEKNYFEEKFNGECQARQKVVTRVNDANEANHKLSQQVQQLQQQLQQTQQQLQLQQQQSNVPPPESDDIKKIRELNNNLQRRNDFLENENEFLKNEQANAPPPPPPSPNLERALNEEKMASSMLSEEKNRMEVELKTANENLEKMKAQLEKSDWMTKMLSEQLDFCKKNTEMWQENTRNLTDHIKRINATTMAPQQGMAMQQPCYTPPAFMHHLSSLSSSHSSFLTPPNRRNHSATPSSFPSTTDLITLEDDNDNRWDQRTKKEET